MKLKTDFVTNSSSSSFMIPKSALTEKQMMMIRDHIHTANYLTKQYPNNENYKFGYIQERQQWMIEETDHSISGHTSMDNFNMFAFLIAIGVPNNEIHMETN